MQEAIERYKSTCKEEIIETANAWITDHKRKLKKRLEVKLAVHTPRLPRLKMDVYDIRLAELRSHFDRVKRHEAVSITFKFNKKYLVSLNINFFPNI